MPARLPENLHVRQKGRQKVECKLSKRNLGRRHRWVKFGQEVRNGRIRAGEKEIENDVVNDIVGELGQSEVIPSIMSCLA